MNPKPSTRLVLIERVTDDAGSLRTVGTDLRPPDEEGLRLYDRPAPTGDSYGDAAPSDSGITPECLVRRGGQASPEAALAPV